MSAFSDLTIKFLGPIDETGNIFFNCDLDFIPKTGLEPKIDYLDDFYFVNWVVTIPARCPVSFLLILNSGYWRTYKGGLDNFFFIKFFFISLFFSTL